MTHRTGRPPGRGPCTRCPGRRSQSRSPRPCSKPRPPSSRTRGGSCRSRRCWCPHTPCRHSSARYWCTSARDTGQSPTRPVRISVKLYPVLWIWIGSSPESVSNQKLYQTYLKCTFPYCKSLDAVREVLCAVGTIYSH